MIRGRMYPVVLGICAALLIAAHVQAGPLLRFPRESEDYPNSDFSNYTANEVCFSDQKVFQRGEEVPNAGPCEECRCEPPSIVCQMLKCPVNNNGCRTIQRPNHCCPDYNCECDYNGQLYNDGERIDLPEDPCQVCYCKGGDVMCTSITCYQRDDCEPKHVPGQCCPKFEDCPIRDMEASNTEDKSVQTRSPNKTMNSNPKKEMQPWLLTKSVPQTSSSLAVPKSGETTTDSGSVIIVSDWLIERKTTEDFNTKHTEDPDYSTHQELTTTAQPQKPTQYIEKESNVEQNMQTVKPTSIDEVVFTRIDIPKRLQEKIHDSLTTTASTEVESNTLFALNLSDIENNPKILLENNTLNVPSDSSDKYTDDKLIAKSKTDKENISSIIIDKEQQNESVKTISSTDLADESLKTQTSAVTKNDIMKEKSTQDNVSSKTSSTPEHFEDRKTGNNLSLDGNKESQVINESTQNENVKTAFTTKPADFFESPTNLSEGVTISDDKDRSPEEMSLEQLFGLEGLEEGESPKQVSASTEEYTGNAITLPDNKKNGSTLPVTTDKIFTVEDSKDDYSFTNEAKTKIDKLQEINHVAIIDLVKKENSSNLNELLSTTETSYINEETTTSFSSESSTNKLPLQQDKLLHESNEEDEETTYLPETTTEIETSTFFFVNIPKQLNDETKGSVLDNLIERKEEDNIYHNIDTTPPSSIDSSTDPVTSESSKSSTTQGFELNTKIMLSEDDFKNNNIQEDSSLSFNSKGNAFTDSTPTKDHKEMNKQAFSEIEVILGETNNTNMLDKSVSSQESDEKDEVVLDLTFDEISSENKELFHANHPPVLELNSHVPFLQIGGDGNSESSDSEYDQTTILNNLEIVDNFDKNAIQGNKEIIKLIKHEDRSKSSFTTIPPTTEILPSTKEPSNKTVEEFTIPTIAVVPLTPGDLKMIAEYLISEKIKPVSSKNNSTYSPNQWLKGNLTSEENIASILSAANVSIGLMNETNIGRKLETFHKSNQSGRLDKFEKETRYKSNSILENKNIVTSKTDSLHDKNRHRQETFKPTTSSQEEINNDRKTSENVKTEATSNGITTIIVPLKTINNTSEQDFENFQNHNVKSSSSESINKTGTQRNIPETSLASDKDLSRTATDGTIKMNNKVTSKNTTPSFNDSIHNETATVNKHFENTNFHKTENLEIRDKMNQGTKQIIPRFPVVDKKSLDSFNTNKNEHNLISEQTTKSINDKKQNETTMVDSLNKTFENEHKAGNLEASEDKIKNQGTTPIITSLTVTDEKPSDSSTTNEIDTTTSKLL